MKYFAALDLGTKKTVAIVARFRGDSEVEVLGWGQGETRGVKNGKVVHIEEASETIRKVIEEAEMSAGVDVDAVFVNVGGKGIMGINNSGRAIVQGEEVTEEDKLRAIEASKRITLPADRVILHVIAQEYFIDDQGEIKEPLGMVGSRLEVDVYIITHSRSLVKNLERCVEKAGFPIQAKVLNQFASQLAVLNEDEKELGVVLLDIGAGTTDLVILNRGGIVYAQTYPIGGKDFTSDIAIGLQTTIKDAERIKVSYASLLSSGKEEDIEVPLISGEGVRKISSRDLYHIVFPRAEQLFGMIKNDLDQLEWDVRATAGVVLTGGGALLDGLKSFAESYFGTYVRVGKPQEREGLRKLDPSFLSPEYSTVLGILYFAMRQKKIYRYRKGGLLLKKIRRFLRRGK